MVWVLDLDGVVWRGDQAIAGAADAVAQLKKNGIRVLFATNNSSLDSVGFVGKLARLGIDTTADDVVHGGHGAAQVMSSGQVLLNCGGPGVAECAAARGVEVIDVGDVKAVPAGVDLVTVGIRADYQFSWLNLAVQAVLDGAQLVAPSGDPLYPQSQNFAIGGGAMAFGVGFAAGVDPIVTGKPSKYMAKAVLSRVRDKGPHSDEMSTIDMLVGDQIATDGQLAQELRCPFGLVDSGVDNRRGDGRYGEAHIVDIDRHESSLAEIVASYFRREA